MAAIFELLGAATLGSFVGGTLKSQIVLPSSFVHVELCVLGFFSSLVSSSVWLLFATFMGYPVSTTQTIVGGITGFASVEVGISNINYVTIINIVVSWVVSPLLGGLISWLIHLSIHYFIFLADHPHDRSLIFLPGYYSLSGVVVAGLIVINLKKIFSFSIAWGIPILISFGCACFVLSKFFLLPYLLKQDDLIKNKCQHVSTSSGEEIEFDVLSELAIKEDDNVMDMVEKKKLEIELTEDKFKWLMIFSAIFVAYSHGANDVANSIAPFSAILEWYLTGDINDSTPVPFYLTSLGGVAIVIGLAVLGYKVVQTVGEQIIKLTFSRGFAAQMGASTTVVLGTILGIPLSTTSVLIGSIAGTGLVRKANEEAFNKKLLAEIVVSWVVTLVIGFCMTSVVYWLMKYVLYSHV
eukprot:TRINITY_DN7445_c0_g1_i10.p1 TRINITY_DN7445_c0_g1~~TRINITY_DN7445_c0_g1_i10.p1  ORF type:complete len:410 (-),score=84.59 TRINITY_DN7445_c0_g1_i10:331-1560(-)